METFGTRLRDAMVLSGKSIAAVARHCKVNRRTVEKWLAMKDAELSGAHLATVSLLLRCRMQWLATGAGPAELVATDPEIAALVALALRLRK